jgi:hypothetical protein
MIKAIKHWLLKIFEFSFKLFNEIIIRNNNMQTFSILHNPKLENFELKIKRALEI